MSSIIEKLEEIPSVQLAEYKPDADLVVVHKPASVGTGYTFSEVERGLIDDGKLTPLGVRRGTAKFEAHITIDEQQMRKAHGFNFVS